MTAAAAPKLPIVYVANVAIYFLRPVAGSRPGDAIYIFASVCNISIENININILSTVISIIYVFCNYATYIIQEFKRSELTDLQSLVDQINVTVEINWTKKLMMICLWNS